MILTDGLRAVERNFGRLHDGQSATLAPGDDRRLANPTRDYLPEGADPWVTWAQYDGVSGVRASSSRSDVTAGGVVQRGMLPYAALDDSTETYWQASEGGPDAWWEVALDAPTSVSEVSVTAGPSEREVVRVRAGDQVTAPVTIPPGATRTIRLDDVETDVLRVEDASERIEDRMSLAEVDIPGVAASRALVLAPVPEAWGSPARIVLRAVFDDRTGCVEISRSVRCVPGREVAPEEPLGFRRIVTLPEAASYDGLELRVRGRAGAELQALLDEGQVVTANASSSSNPDLRSSGLAAIDGDPGTTWSAALSDRNPQLDLRWDGQRTFSGLDLRLLPDADARLPNELVLSWPGGRRSVEVDEDGEVRFPPIRTDRLTLAVEEADPAVDLDFDQTASPVPIGISEVRVLGVSTIPRSIGDELISTPCGAGPALSIGDETFPTAVEATAQALYAGDIVSARVCGDGAVELPEGSSDISASASRLFTPISLVLSDGTTWDSEATPATVDRASPVDMTVIPDSIGGVLAVRQNANRGWVATQDGTTLHPIVVDGWQQGWQLDSGSEVRAQYEPDGIYRAGLLGGAAALLLLVIATLLPWRPWRDTDSPALRAARYPAAVVVVLGLTAAGVLAGWAGFAIGSAAILVGAVAGRLAHTVAGWLVVAAMGAAAAAYLLRPWGDQNGWAGDLAWPHYLVLVALCVLVGGVLDPGRPRFFSRMNGRSTTR